MAGPPGSWDVRIGCQPQVHRDPPERVGITGPGPDSPSLEGLCWGAQYRRGEGRLGLVGGEDQTVSPAENLGCVSLPSMLPSLLNAQQFWA